MCSHILKPFTAPSTLDPPGLEEEVRLDERLTEDILWQREREKDEEKGGLQRGGVMTNMEQEEGRGEEGS